jgi:hypothetical protein
MASLDCVDRCFLFLGDGKAAGLAPKRNVTVANGGNQTWIVMSQGPRISRKCQ